MSSIFENLGLASDGAKQPEDAKKKPPAPAAGWSSQARFLTPIIRKAVISKPAAAATPKSATSATLELLSARAGTGSRGASAAAASGQQNSDALSNTSSSFQSAPSISSLSSTPGLFASIISGPPPSSAFDAVTISSLHTDAASGMDTDEYVDGAGNGRASAAALKKQPQLPPAFIKKKGKSAIREPVVWTDEYNPEIPNDYDEYKAELERRQEEAEFEQERKRLREMDPSEYESFDGGNRLQGSTPQAPPEKTPAAAGQLQDAQSGEEAYLRRAALSAQARGTVSFPPPTSYAQADPSKAPMSSAGSEAQAEKGNFAQKLMNRYGWKEGSGLGKNLQGISTALDVQKTQTKSGGIIINPSAAPSSAAESGPAVPAITSAPPYPASESKIYSSAATLPPPPQKAIAGGPATASTVLLLKNMVGPGEVDDLLQDETAEECGKYGQVEKCLIFEVPGGLVPPEEAVRIFVKFSKPEESQRAISDLDNRFFGGRTVRASLYEETRFAKLDLAPRPGEISKA